MGKITWGAVFGFIHILISFDSKGIPFYCGDSEALAHFSAFQGGCWCWQKGIFCGGFQLGEAVGFGGA